MAVVLTHIARCGADAHNPYRLHIGRYGSAGARSTGHAGRGPRATTLRGINRPGATRSGDHSPWLSSPPRFVTVTNRNPGVRGTPETPGPRATVPLLQGACGAPREGRNGNDPTRADLDSNRRCDAGLGNRRRDRIDDLEHLGHRYRAGPAGNADNCDYQRKCTNGTQPSPLLEPCGLRDPVRPTGTVRAMHPVTDLIAHVPGTLHEHHCVIDPWTPLSADLQELLAHHLDSTRFAARRSPVRPRIHRGRRRGTIAAERRRRSTPADSGERDRPGPEWLGQRGRGRGRYQLMRALNNGAMKQRPGREHSDPVSAIRTLTVYSWAPASNGVASVSNVPTGNDRRP